MSLFFLKRSATTNSTSVINQKTSQASQSSHHHHHQSSSVSVQNLLSLTKRYSFFTQTDLTNSDLLLTSPSTNTSSSSNNNNNNNNNKSLNNLNDLNDAKREREKFNVLKEVISSEKKYLNDLREIVDGYYDEISKFKHDNKEFVYHIFSNIKDIYEFTK
jgi:hypothetical protein